MFFAAARIRQMTDEIAVQLVNIDAPKIVKLFALKAENLATCDHGDMDAFAIQYIAIHDLPPVPGMDPRQRLRSLAGDSETNRCARHFSFAGFHAFAVTRLARYSGSVAYLSALSRPGKCLTTSPFRLTVHHPSRGPCGPDSIGTTS